MGLHHANINTVRRRGRDYGLAIIQKAGEEAKVTNWNCQPVETSASVTHRRFADGSWWGFGLLYNDDKSDVWGRQPEAKNDSPWWCHPLTFFASAQLDWFLREAAYNNIYRSVHYPVPMAGGLDCSLVGCLDLTDASLIRSPVIDGC